MPAPVVETLAAEVFGGTTVRANGRAVPNGNTPYSYGFEWGPTEALGESREDGSGSFNGEISDAAFLETPKAQTTYYFRFWFKVGAETFHGAILSVKTEGSEPTVKTLDAEIVGDEVKLKGEGTDGGIGGVPSFEYGETEAYGSKVPYEGSPEEFYAVLLGLTPGQTYHYRAVFKNELGTAFGEDKTFVAPEGGPPPEEEGTVGVDVGGSLVEAKTSILVSGSLVPFSLS